MPSREPTMTDTDSSAWRGNHDQLNSTPRDPGANIREQKLARMRALEEQKRKQRNSTAGRVFQSNNEITLGARPSSRNRHSITSQSGLLANRRSSGAEEEDDDDGDDDEEEDYNDVLPASLKHSISEESIDRVTLTTESKTTLKLKERGMGMAFDPTIDDLEEDQIGASTVTPINVKDDEKAADTNSKPSKPISSVLTDLDTSNIAEFIGKPAPQGTRVQCRIIRSKGGVEKSVYPTYCLYVEMANNQKVFLLAGRKRKKSTTSNYLISMNQDDLARHSDNFIGKLRSNFVGTSFTLYNNGENPKRGEKDNSRLEVAAVQYDTNIMGWKGPRKMTVIIPSIKENGVPAVCQPRTDHDSLLERYKDPSLNDNLLLLHNKAPFWNEDTQSYVLNFHGRVTMASVKNFQIVHDDDPEYIVLQFGRVGGDSFTLDYQYPMTALQAFGIVLSSFDGKLACE